MTAGGGYALDLLSPVRHVATEMERAAPRALSIEELTSTYKHPVLSDLGRVRAHEGRRSDYEATRWLVAQALTELGDQVSYTGTSDVSSGGGFVLAKPFDALRYQGHRINRVGPDVHVRLRAPFDPMSDRFSEKVRNDLSRDRATTAELRESLLAFGWIPELPAIEDERGVVLVGHRRLKLAAELGIKPVVRTIRLGEGDAADARRFALAIGSNLGGKGFTQEERKDFAEYLYDEREWSMDRIAEALKVGTEVVSQDLTEQHRSRHTSSRQVGGNQGYADGKPRLTPEQDAEIVRLRLDEGWAREKVAEHMGVSNSVVQKATDWERGRREERERWMRWLWGARCPHCDESIVLDELP